MPNVVIRARMSKVRFKLADMVDHEVRSFFQKTSPMTGKAMPAPGETHGAHASGHSCSDALCAIFYDDAIRGRNTQGTGCE